MVRGGEAEGEPGDAQPPLSASPDALRDEPVAHLEGRLDLAVDEGLEVPLGLNEPL